MTSGNEEARTRIGVSEGTDNTPRQQAEEALLKAGARWEGLCYLQLVALMWNCDLRAVEMTVAIVPPPPSVIELQWTTR